LVRNRAGNDALRGDGIGAWLVASDTVVMTDGGFG